MGVISFEVYNSVYNITSKNNTLQFINNELPTKYPSEQDGGTSSSQKLIDEYIEMMDETFDNEINIYTDNEDSLFDVYYLSDLDYESSRKYIIEGLKNQPYETNYINLKYRMKLTDEEIEYITQGFARSSAKHKERRSIPDPFILDFIEEIRKNVNKKDTGAENSVEQKDDLLVFKEQLKDEQTYNNYIKINLNQDMNIDWDDETLRNNYTQIGIKAKSIEKILLNVKISKLK